MTTEPVTTIIARSVHPGRVEEFEDWLESVAPLVREYEGFQGMDVIRPGDHVHPEYVVILRFDSYDHLRAWMESNARRRWLNKAEDMVLGETYVEEASGMELWFTLPDTDIHTPAPPKYKLALLTVLVIYPLILLSNETLGLLMANLPYLLTLFISIAIISILMSYLVMPTVTRLFAFWLYPSIRSNRG